MIHTYMYHLCRVNAINAIYINIKKNLKTAIYAPGTLLAASDSHGHGTVASRYHKPECTDSASVMNQYCH